MSRKDAWTEYELQMLYERVLDADFLTKLCHQLDRSPNAISARMAQLRKEAGINVKAARYGREAQLESANDAYLKAVSKAFGDAE